MARRPQNPNPAPGVPASEAPISNFIKAENRTNAVWLDRAVAASSKGGTLVGDAFNRAMAATNTVRAVGGRGAAA